MNKSLLTNVVAVSLIGTGYISPVYSAEIKTMGLYSFSGAITNWLAVHMLFEKVPFLYGSGIVTERFEEFKKGIRGVLSPEEKAPDHAETEEVEDRESADEAESAGGPEITPADRSP